MKSLIVLVISAAMSASGILLADTNEIFRASEGFTVDLGNELKITKQTSVDFHIYSISKAGTNVAFIYAGNQPTFPRERNGQIGDRITMELEGYRCMTYYNGSEVVGLEMLIHPKTRDTALQVDYLHAWTASGARGTDFYHAQKALLSLKLLRISRGNL